MKEIAVYLLKCFTSVTFGLALFYILLAYEFLSVIPSNLSFLAPVILVLVSFIVIFKGFSKLSRAKLTFLTILFWLSVGAISFYGFHAHKHHFIEAED